MSALVLALIVVGLHQSSAFAIGEYKRWNSLATPLTVRGYGSTATGYGSWRVASTSDGTGSFLDANLRYHNADDHKVYATLQTWTNAGYCLQNQYLSCNAAYYPYATSNTVHSNITDRWKMYYTHTGVNPSGNYARALIQVKLDIPWRTDSVSGTTYTPGTAY